MNIISGSIVSLLKSIMIDWVDQPLGWCNNLDLARGDPNHQVKYLGIPFLVNPNLQGMWDWIKGKIEGKFSKWNTNNLSGTMGKESGGVGVERPYNTRA